ncbi:iron-sulfur cluster co-chaperone protein HscB [Ahaetulla prasina]|uniref:iron-sulfur cluster co-chaperone protein HscB n=1 Tax=Ahaetulla prasina TaxID=499056 RepID=UPI002649643B|nr:iron-sulfur cluster co-chaperone protein HscB [Ahaetulla prasina]XP_058014567.1 iron-sulfur cluster co-chaperone protein HscB [Ahaetulla prasina]
MWRRALRARPPRRARSQAAGRRCWSCGAPLGSEAPGPGFCPSCRALQPPEPRADLFGVLGCPRGFSLDLARLRQRFLALQRSLHPDRFSRRPQAERGFSEQHAALINLAYGTLRSPLSRGLYLLELRGVELAAGSDAEAEPGFLAEVLELNEQLAAADSEASLAGLESLLAAKQEALVQEVSRAFEQDDLHKARRLLSKMKYFANLEEKVKEKKAPS